MIQKIKTKLIKLLKEDSSGSAIILALIIIAGLAGTGLGAARLTQQNTQLNTEYEDSLKAYYAAEAGVEAALLEWRYNHDVEFWDQDLARSCYENGGKGSDCEKAKVKKCVTLDDNNAIGDIMNSEGEIAQKNCTEAEKIKGKPWYELRIYYRNPEWPYLGNFNRDNPASIIGVDKFYQTKEDLPLVMKDDTREIKFPVTDKVDNVAIIWMTNDFSPNLNGGGDMVRLLVHTVAKRDDGADCLVNNTGDVMCDGNTVVSDLNGKFYTRDVKRANSSGASYSSIINRMSGYDAITNVRVKCLSNNTDGGVYIAVAARTGGQDGDLIHVPGDVTTIEAVGHYNGVERKLVYTIDRQSGTIQNVYDFGVMSKETLRK